MRLHKIFILLLAAGAGALFYKIRHTLTEQDNSSIPGHSLYSSLTGSGSLMEAWHTGTAARDIAMTGNGAPPTNYNSNLVTNYSSKKGHGLPVTPQANNMFAPVTPAVTSEGPPDDMLLMTAAAKGDQATVEKRIAAHGKIDSRDSLRRTPLMYAAWSGYDDISARLLAAGANAEFKDRAGNNAYDYAASRGLIDTLNFLLQRTHENDDHHYVEYAQIVQATYAADISKLPAGNDKLESVNRLNPEGNAPLHIAASNGAAGLMEALIKRGAQVDLTDNNRQTPLHWAAWNNQTGAMQLLLDKGASIAETDLSGNTPLMLAAQNGNADAVTLLLGKGADRYAANKEGKTAALIAEDNGHKDVAALLK